MGSDVNATANAFSQNGFSVVLLPQPDDGIRQLRILFGNHELSYDEVLAGWERDAGFGAAGGHGRSSGRVVLSPVSPARRIPGATRRRHHDVPHCGAPYPPAAAWRQDGFGVGGIDYAYISGRNLDER